MDELILNEHNKEEFPPAHTAEHLLNQLMVRKYGCERSRTAHIERKKSKITYQLANKPTRKEEKFIEDEMNRLIDEDMPVTYEFVDRDHIPWYASAITTSAHVSASMCALLGRLAILLCSAPIGTKRSAASE